MCVDVASAVISKEESLCVLMLRAQSSAKRSLCVCVDVESAVISKEVSVRLP